VRAFQFLVPCAVGAPMALRLAACLAVTALCMLGAANPASAIPPPLGHCTASRAAAGPMSVSCPFACGAGAGNVVVVGVGAGPRTVDGSASCATAGLGCSGVDVCVGAFASLDAGPGTCSGHMSGSGLLLVACASVGVSCGSPCPIDGTMHPVEAVLPGTDLHLGDGVCLGTACVALAPGTLALWANGAQAPHAVLCGADGCHALPFA